MSAHDAIIEELKLMKLFMVIAFAGIFWALFFIVPNARIAGIVLMVVFALAGVWLTRRAFTLLNRLKDGDE